MYWFSVFVMTTSRGSPPLICIAAYLAVIISEFASQPLGKEVDDKISGEAEQEIWHLQYLPHPPSMWLPFTGRTGPHYPALKSVKD